MNFEELQRLAASGESESIEFKLSTGQLKEMGKSLCGFLNRRGGVLLVGINENGGIVGQLVSDKTLQDVGHMLNEMSPAAPVSLFLVDIPDSQKKVIALRTEGTLRTDVYFYHGRAYERIGTTTLETKPTRLRQIMFDRYPHGWDSLSAKGFTLEDLDHSEITKTLEEGVATGRLSRALFPKDNVEEALRGLQLLRNGQLTHAAMVLFAKELPQEYSQCELKMARFYGIDKNQGFLDEKRFLGNAFRTLEEAYNFVRRHLNIRMEFDPNRLERVETPQLPFLAVREALINSVCHRDYSYYSGSMTLAIYDDRLEIWNMGELPLPLRPEDLKTHHDSILRNPNIAHLFYVRDYVESWGSGINRMISLCQKLGVPDPEYAHHTGGLCVTFRFNEPSQSISQNRISKEPLWLTTLAGREKKIAEQLFLHPAGLPIRNIMKQLNEPISRTTLKRVLEKMQQLGWIVQKGTTRNAYWVLKISPSYERN